MQTWRGERGTCCGCGGRERVHAGTEGKERGHAGRRRMARGHVHILRERGDIKDTEGREREDVDMEVEERVRDMHIHCMCREGREGDMQRGRGKRGDMWI